MALFSQPEQRALCLREEKDFIELTRGQEDPTAVARPVRCAVSAGSDMGAEWAAQ